MFRYPNFPIRNFPHLHSGHTWKNSNVFKANINTGCYNCSHVSLNGFRLFSHNFGIFRTGIVTKSMKFIYFYLVWFAFTLHCVKQTKPVNSLFTPVACGGAAPRATKGNDIYRILRHMSRSGL